MRPGGDSPVQTRRHDMHDGMAATDTGVAEQINLAFRGAADERWIAVQNELLAGNETGGDLQPAALGGVFDEARAGAGENTDCQQGDQAAEMHIASQIEERAPGESADESTEQSDDQFFGVSHDQTGADSEE